MIFLFLNADCNCLTEVCETQFSELLSADANALWYKDREITVCGSRYLSIELVTDLLVKGWSMKFKGNKAARLQRQIVRNAKRVYR